jgi:hypothetical protein
MYVELHAHSSYSFLDGASLPEELAALSKLARNLRWGHAGVKDRYGVHAHQIADYLGIDQGPILIMAENYRTGLIWNLLRKHPAIIRGLKRAGFTGGWLDQ